MMIYENFYFLDIIFVDLPKQSLMLEINFKIF